MLSADEYVPIKSEPALQEIFQTVVPVSTLVLIVKLYAQISDWFDSDKFPWCVL